MSTSPEPTADALFDYSGDEAWRAPITEALRRVVDPEVALSILDVGLVYRVAVEPEKAHVVMTMTSAACPVTDVILDDVYAELERVLPIEMDIAIELCWEPAWTPARMSEAAQRFMRW